MRSECSRRGRFQRRSELPGEMNFSGAADSLGGVCLGTEGGFATLLVLLLLTALFLYGAEGYVRANAENRMAHREAQSRQAVYAAEGGIEWAKDELLLNPDLKAGRLSLDGGEVAIAVESASDPKGGSREEVYLVTSTARVGRAERKISVVLKRSLGRWLVLCYREIHQ
ncbi:Hypothetical protein DEACI_2259 [Acididesulfobacillus acetoxydans]|uniref:Uncharacterized protein n=1 Tax=Acididesulfobacillus acetoxydans TaxID=1561005 RepID=A0A8S0WG49_9FIRM|nr:hypothetical protein [Acididesulfobacillus acetoxydans]CAA7601592.1 Hypothetical protein DEACI_2259 [Acididesulfobacillus acetoxydans]CEJ07079.1 Hypothetical protein DEACI_1535 [Acididesulfobacillus acetoxydans]